MGIICALNKNDRQVLSNAPCTNCMINLIEEDPRQWFWELFEFDWRRKRSKQTLLFILAESSSSVSKACLLLGYTLKAASFSLYIPEIEYRNLLHRRFTILYLIWKKINLFGSIFAGRIDGGGLKTRLVGGLFFLDKHSPLNFYRFDHFDSWKPRRDCSTRRGREVSSFWAEQTLENICFSEGSFLAWNATGLCTRSSIPSFPELIKIFQVRGQLNNKERSTETTPRTLNQLLINIYRAVVNMEHLQHRFLPIGAALTMNNWITLGNLSYVMISLSRMRYVSYLIRTSINLFQFTRIALDYSAGPQINGRTFRFYFPEAWLQLQEAKNDPKHPDYDAVIYEAPHKDPNPYTLFRLHPVLPRSTMDSFIDYWNNFTADNLLKTFPLFAFKMAVRHRLFPMVMMRENLQESIKEHYKEDLENAEELDAKTYAKDTLMDILLRILFKSQTMVLMSSILAVSTDGWKTLLMLLTRQTDTDEEKLLIQNHEGSPVLKLAKFIVRSEAKYGVSF